MRKILRKLLKPLGYDLVRLKPREGDFHMDLIHDVAFLLKGVAGLPRNGRIKLVLCGATFCELCRGQASPHALLADPDAHGDRPVSIHEPHFRDNLQAWCDMLFIHRGLLPEGVT